MEQLKHRDSDSFCQYELLLPSLASYYSRDKSLLMSRCNVIFLPFSLTCLSRWAPNARCLVADDAFTSAAEYRRRRC